MKKYFAYVRVSTTKQGQEGVSLAEQKSAIRQYADREGLAISGWFEETITAAKQGRPVFSAVLDKIRDGEAAGLIVHKLDRGTRNLDEWIILRDLHKEGIDLRIVVENIDLSTRSGRMIGNFQAIIAEDYIENLRQETLKGQMGRLKQGLTPWAAPVGYLDNGKGKPKTIDPVMGSLVKELFELYASGSYDIRALARYSHQSGLRNTVGGKLHKTCISRILNNPFYMGRIYVKRWDKTFDGVHEPLVSKSLFYAVRDRLEGKVRSAGYKHRYRYSRLFRCSLCGYSMIAERQKGHVYYRCHTKECRTKGIREEVIDKSVLGLLEHLMLDETTIESFADLLEARRLDRNRSAEQAFQKISLERSNTEARRKRLTDLRLDGEIDEAEFKTKKAEIQRRLDELDEKERLIQSDPEQSDTELHNFLELSKRLISTDIAEPSADIIDLLGIVSSNRTVSPNGVDISCHLPWNLVVEQADSLSCGQDRDHTRTQQQVVKDLLAYFTGQHPQRPQSPQK